MRLIKIFVLTAVLCSAIFSLHNAFAQEPNQEDLIKSFNFDDFPGEVILKYGKNSDMLDGYIMCLAGIRNDISLCENILNTPFCRNRFKELHVYYKELINSKSASPVAISVLMESGKQMNAQQATAAANAFLAKDVNFCKGITTVEEQRDCKAIMSRSPQSCASIGCQSRVYFVKALEENDAKVCDQIKEEGVKMLCKSEFSTNEDSCKQCSGFKKFIKEYYESQPKEAE